MTVRAGLILCWACLLCTWATTAQAEPLYGTFLGGSGADSVNDLAVDSQGRVVIAGRTDSVDWPGYAESPWPRATCSWDCTDAFVARLSADGRRVDWFVWLSGTDYDVATDVAVGPGDVVWVHGVTDSPDFRTVNAPQPRINNYDTFVGRIDASGTPTMVTFLGGGSFDRAGDIAVAPDGDAVAVGETREGFKTTPGAFQEQPLSADGSGFAARYAADGSSLEAATYIGRPGGWDWATAAAIDPASGAVVIGGNWIWETYPTSDAGDVPFAGYNDAWVAAFDPGLGKRLWATARGTDEPDELTSVAIGPAGQVNFLARHIDDGWPTTEGAWDRGGWDTSFSAVESLGVTGGGRDWATLLGSSPDTVAVEHDGRVLIGAFDFGTRFRATDPPCPCPLVGYLVRMAADGSALEGLEVLSGRADPRGMKPLADGTVWVAGPTYANFTPTADAIDSTQAGGTCEGSPCPDAFVARVRLGPYPPPATTPGSPSPAPPPSAPPPGAQPGIPPAHPVRPGRAKRRLVVRVARRGLLGRVESARRACTHRVRVLVERRSRGRWVVRRRGRTGPTGRFRLSRVPNGRLRVRVPATASCEPASRLVSRRR